MKIKFRPKLFVLFAARAFGLFKISRYLTKSQLRILCYHGGAMGDEYNFNPKLFCSPDTLQRRMEWMREKGFNFVKLDDAIKEQGGSGLKAPLKTVITFDDGWYSTASTLLPVLSAMKIPSTLYLSTKDFLDSCPIVAVTVRYIIWKAHRRSVTIRGWGIDVDSEYDLQNARERIRLAERVVASISVFAIGRLNVSDALSRFADDLGVPAAELQLDSRRFDYMTQRELIEITKQGCSIESHGHMHVYPKGEPAQFAEDLRKCEDTIVGLGLPQPRHYCYPSGSFGAEASATLRTVGIRSATTCIPGLIDKITGERCHYLPRFLDGGDVHPLEFESEMSGFSELARIAISFVKRPRTSWQADLPEPIHADA